MSGALSDVLHQYKLFHVIMHWGRITLNSVLKWSLDFQKKKQENLYEMIIENKCKKSFHRDQLKSLQEGITVDSLDISLAFLLLLHIGSLSKYDDPSWQNSSTLEYKLKMVKHHRNNSCHPSDSVTEKHTTEKIKELRQLYDDILSAAGKRFLIEEGVVRMKIFEITNGVDSTQKKIREKFDPYDDQELENFHKEFLHLLKEKNRTQKNRTQKNRTQKNRTPNSYVQEVYILDESTIPNAVHRINSLPKECNVNNLLEFVVEYDYSEDVAAAVARRIDVKSCRIKEGYLEALPKVFDFVHPTDVIFEPTDDPNNDPHLFSSIKFVSERPLTARMTLKFKYNYNSSSDGIDNKYIELFTKNQKCHLVGFLGRLTLTGFSMLPKCLEELYLRISDSQISTLNETLPRLKNLTLLDVVLDLSNRPKVDSVECIKFTERKFNLQVAGDMTDEEAIYASDILGRLYPSGINSLNNIEFKETNLTSIGIQTCLEELHKNNILGREIIFHTSKVIPEGEMAKLVKVQLDMYGNFDDMNVSIYSCIS